MARNIITTITDDIDGSPEAFGVTFSLNGSNYEIDLSAKNADKLVKALAPFIEHARKVTATKSTKPAAKSTKSTGAAPAYDKAAFKTWAVENDIKLSRGRVPRELVEKFLASAA